MSLLPQAKARKVMQLRVAAGLCQPDRHYPQDAEKNWYYYPRKTGYKRLEDTPWDSRRGNMQ